MAASNKVKDKLTKHESMEQRRAPWMPYYQQLADVLLPNQADFITLNRPGEQRGVGIYDGTPRLALRDLSTTLDGLIKPKSSNWFDVEVEDEDLMAMDETKLWLEVVKDRMWNHLYRKDARFIQRSGEVDLALCCYGWGVLWAEENRAKNGLLFRSFHNSQVCFDEDAEGIIDTIAVQELLTARQAAMLYERIGKEPSKPIRDALMNTSKFADKKFPFIQIVEPNPDYNPRATLGKAGMAFYSCLIDKEAEGEVEDSYYYEFPAAIPRWETSPGELYPRSPGMIALPDAQTLQAMGKTLLVGGQRAVDPPIWISNDSVVSPLRTFPGGVTVLDTSDGGTPVGAFPVATNLPVGREMQADYRAMVEAAFFKNVFNLPIESHAMTATEIVARKEEFIRVIGPVFGRLETDYIGKTVERVFGIMDRAGAFPPRPDHLVGSKVSFKFQSPIQKARKQMEIASLGQALGFLGPLAEVQPEILDNFDGNVIARDAPEWSGMPNKWLRSQKDVDARRAAAQQQGQAQQELAAAGPITEALKNVASANEMLTPV